MLPDGQFFTDFTVAGEGFIIYWHKYARNYKVRCPGGRIYPIADNSFIINDELYSCQDEKIIKWEMIGDNELKEKEVCGFKGYTPIVMNNYARHTALLQDAYGHYYEFDGESCQEIEIPDNFRNWEELNNNNFCTSKAWYIRENTRFNKLNMETYQESQFEISDYEIQNLSANNESPNITFNGIRYLDGVNVIGIITEADEVVIENMAENGNKIIDLISLN